MERYRRQIACPAIGAQGQERLAQSRVTLIGCGALGTVLADGFTRAGVGFLRIVDRDFPEWNNLQRQTLFDEDDVRSGLPKAEAAVRKLRRVNSDIHLEAVVADVNASTISAHASNADLLVDGTDNFETRFLINDYAISSNIPWVYGGCIGTRGMCMAIVPGQTACLRCVMPRPPAPGSTETCETAGVLGCASGLVAQLQIAESLKILTGQLDRLRPGLLNIDLWTNDIQTLRTAKLREQASCPCCHHRQFEYLHATGRGRSAVLCGRDAVHLTPVVQAGAGQVELASLASRLQTVGNVCVLNSNAFLVRFEAEGLQITVFADARAIIKGTSEIPQARAVYHRYVGA